MGYKLLAEQDCRPSTGGCEPARWSPLIDGEFVYVGLQEVSPELPGYSTQWRVTLYQSEAQGVQRYFNNPDDARATYDALVSGPVPWPETLVNVWDFEWNF
jgi:hypothetical protein